MEKEYKNLMIWKSDHDKLKRQAMDNERPMLKEIHAMVNSNVRIIDGKRYRVMPMDSDSLTGGNVRPAKMARSNRVVKDG